jgi:hypothetical protein
MCLTCKTATQVADRVAGFPSMRCGLFRKARNRVVAFAASGETGIRVDLQDGTLVLITPNFWAANNVWYMGIPLELENRIVERTTSRPARRAGRFQH